MSEYRLPPTLYAEARTKILVWTLLIGAVMGGAGIWIGIRWIQSREDDLSLPPFVLFLVVAAALIGLIFGVVLGLRRVQQSWASYRLILAENSIKRVQDGYPDVTILNNEISKITETEGRGLVVHSVTPYTYIGIPFAIQEYSEVRSELEKKHAIDKSSRARGKLTLVLAITISLFIPVALLVTFLAANKYVIVVMGVALCFVLLFTELGVQRSRSISKWAKSTSWLGFLLLLVVALRVLFIIVNW